MKDLRLCMRDNCLEFGVDEAGRGKLCCEVVAAAVMIDPEIPLHPYLNDSKKVSPRNRAIVQHWIEENCLFGIGTASASEIDAINIQQATYLAMHRALTNLPVEPDHIVVDGTGFKPFGTIPYTCVPQGDSKYSSVAAASILAKQHNDYLTLELVKKHPYLDEYYGIGQNVGYGSPQHMEGIRVHGSSEFHRMSFAPAKHFRKDSC